MHFQPTVALIADVKRSDHNLVHDLSLAKSHARRKPGDSCREGLNPTRELKGSTLPTPRFSVAEALQERVQCNIKDAIRA
jgi:hypothetical protein